VVFCLLGSIAYIGYSQCTQLWQFYLLSVFVGAGLAGLAGVPISVMITNWFEEKKGLAMGIAFSGSGIGGMVYNPLINWVITNYSWQTAYVFLGVTMLVTLLPVILFVVKAAPAEVGKLPYGAGTEETLTDPGKVQGLTLAQSVKTQTFWMLGLGFLLAGLMNAGIQQHIPAYLTDIGYSSAFAANMVALFMGVLVVGKLLLGVIFDKYGSRVGSVYSCSMLALAVLMLIGARIPILVFIMAIFYGLANAVNTVPVPYITVETMGNRDFGVIFGIMSTFLTLGMSIGMPLSGAVFDRTGSYLPAWYLYLVMSVITAIVLVFAINKSKKYWAENLK
ncbi:MAG TPA: MFS transporter, partial [Syntrophomonadaceae bacterium]|nr:MFS transporter [Syntrophomonadaceae bacterium]